MKDKGDRMSKDLGSVRGFGLGVLSIAIWGVLGVGIGSCFSGCVSDRAYITTKEKSHKPHAHHKPHKKHKHHKKRL